MVDNDRLWNYQKGRLRQGQKSAFIVGFESPYNTMQKPFVGKLARSDKRFWNSSQTRETWQKSVSKLPSCLPSSGIWQWSRLKQTIYDFVCH